MKRLTATAILCGSMLAAVIAGAAGAATVRNFYFHDCVGPSGTPTSFVAVKTAVPDVAANFSALATGYRVVDSLAIFVALVRFDDPRAPGIDDRATITCLVDTPFLGTRLWKGFLTTSL